MIFKIFFISTIVRSFTSGVVRREVGARLGSILIQELSRTGITYCRIDTENVVSRSDKYRNISGF